VDLQDYLDREVYPALFARLDSAFPEFSWRRRGGNWTASTWPSAFPYAVERENPDRLVVYSDRPHWIKLHGHGGVRLLDYVNGGRKPEGDEFLQAVRKLAELAGVDTSPLDRELSSAEAEEVHRREARRSVLDVAMDHAREVLWSARGEKARRYLTEQRKLTEAEVRDLGLGFYFSVSDMRAALEKEGVDLEAARGVGVLWEKLEGYVLFPWADANGQPLTLYGRWHEAKPPEGKPKTLSLPGEGTKRSPFYFDRVRDAGLRDVVLVEGLFDAALLQVRGDRRVVATVAAQLSVLQVETLARSRVRRAFICGDPDGGGDKGTLANIQALTKVGVDCYVVPRLPDGLDPDELVLRDGIEAWRERVEASVSGAVFLAERELENVTPESPEAERRAAVSRALDLVEKMTGASAALDRDAVLEVTRERTGFPVEVLREVAEGLIASRRREDLERGLDVALRAAQAAREKGEASAQVALKLASDLSGLHAKTVEPPPPFSVDRLVKATRSLPEGLSTGWEALDELGVRFNPAELAVLAARTGHGKTSVLVGLLVNWLLQAEREGGDELFLFYSSEEPEERVFHRFLAVLTAMENEVEAWSANEALDYLRDPHSRDRWRGNPAGLEYALERLRPWEDRLLVVHRPLWNVDALHDHALSVADKRPVGAVLVDYLQRIPAPEGSYDRRDIEVSAVSRRLKKLAEELGAPVVTAAQVNREPAQFLAGRLDGKSYREATSEIRRARPDLANLREGGSEQEADLVLGVLNYVADFRTEAKGGEQPPDVTLLEVGTLKHRYGSVGRWAGLAFLGRSHFIRDPRPDEEEALEVEHRPSVSPEAILETRRAVSENRRAAAEARAAAREKAEEAKVQRERAKVQAEQLRLERARLRVVPPPPEEKD
jgi:replicative DNA helicase